jgi:hypothetical protein
VSCVDALARVRFTDPKVGDRIKRFAHTELHSFPSDALAARFYENFRTAWFTRHGLGRAASSRLRSEAPSRSWAD